MKKQLKALSAVLLAFALTTVAVGSVNTETASAKKVNAKTLKLKKKKLKMKVGDTKKLKVTVSPKKASLKWKSSKKNVVSVSKKGKLTANKEGKAKITVTSGKKKASCTVTVKGISKKAVGIKSVSVVNSKVVRVSLTKAKKLSAKDFSVNRRELANAKNRDKLSVASVSNSKNKDYTLVLSTNYNSTEDNNAIASGDYVSVTVKKLAGTKTKETIYYASTVARNQYVGGKTNAVLNRDVYFTTSYKGYLSGVKVTGLPAGLSAEAHDNYVTIKGIPRAVANGTTATMTAKDELGKSLSQKIRFYIGSDSQMVSYIEAENRTILANDNRSESFDIHVYGGTGSYTYSLPGNNNKFISLSDYDSSYDNEIYFDSYEYNDVTDKREYLPAGKYNVAYSVEDSAKHIVKGTLAVTAVNGVKLTGILTAADNSSVESGTVEASFQDTKHAYYRTYAESEVASEDYTDSSNIKRLKGSYELVLYPGLTYNLSAASGGAQAGITNYSIAKANKVQNFKLPLYKVTFASKDVDLKDMSIDIEGVDGDGYKPWNSVYTYLKKGTYIVDERDTRGTVNGFNYERSTYRLSAVFTVNGNMTVNLSYSKLGTDSTTSLIDNEPLELDTTRYVDSYFDDDDFYYEDYYYQFTPSESGHYVIDSNDYQTVTVYDMNRQLLGTYDAVSMDDGYQTDIPLTLNQGDTYVFSFSDSDYVTVCKYIDDTDDSDDSDDSDYSDDMDY